ncbi:hypothetical protein NDU88_001962 [Pleurodeles waltl]|uniref:Uncharacterized protein n=1 Tax=Pleurodeles waltl TaxID=8319 RepID=A0AAV7LZ48_PLEWA|nr:hypothetical protein NDU88_001962 [Pleurodeles waltl]
MSPHTHRNGRLERGPAPGLRGRVEGPVRGGPEEKEIGCPQGACLVPGHWRAHLRRRPGTGLRRDLGLAVRDLENLKSRPGQRRAGDPKNGPYKYDEAGGDRELEEARPGGFPDTHIRERTPQTRRVAAV